MNKIHGLTLISFTNDKLVIRKTIEIVEEGIPISNISELYPILESFTT